MNNLAYNTGAAPKRLNVIKSAFLNNVSNASASGLNYTGVGEAFENGNYYLAGWQGEKYVALNSKIKKLNSQSFRCDEHQQDLAITQHYLQRKLRNDVHGRYYTLSFFSRPQG